MKAVAGNLTVLLVLVVRMLPAAATSSDTAERFTGALEQGDFQAGHAICGREPSRQFSAAGLEAVRHCVPSRLGEYRGRGAARPESISGPSATIFKLDFENMKTDAQTNTLSTGDGS